MRPFRCAALSFLLLAGSPASADVVDDVAAYTDEELDLAIEWAEGLSGGGPILAVSAPEQFAAYDYRAETIGGYDMEDTFLGE